MIDTVTISGAGRTVTLDCTHNGAVVDPAASLPAADDPLVLLAAEAMWFPHFGDEGETFAERDPRLTKHWIEKARHAVAALRPYLNREVEGV